MTTPPSFTILVVDDDANARLIMSAAMRKAGYGVRLAGGGEDALRMFRAEPADLVMLDVDMPGLDGYAVCRALRALAGPLLPIMMVTGMDDVRSVEAAYECGATDFIAKPVHWALIGHRVRYLFRSNAALHDLQVAEARHAAVLDAIPDLLFELDLEGRYIDYRAPRADLLAAPAEVFLGRTVSEILPPAAAEICLGALRHAHAHGASSGEQFELALPGGNRWFELSVARKAVGAGEKPHFIMLSRDITDRKQAEARITRLAYFDSLTGLPNRRSFLDRVDREIRRAARRRDRLAVLFMDLDGFKNVNDTLGHAAGDRLLQQAADRLRDGLRPSDLLSRPLDEVIVTDEVGDEADLARLGGDEFTALIRDIEHPDQALAVARRIGKLMRQPFVIEGRAHSLSTSIGIAFYPDDGPDSASLLKHADTAMYRAKTRGRDNAQIYSSALTDELIQQVELDAALRVALERGELHLVYQPQIDVASGRVHAVEALLRWNHPTRGLVPPQEFIRIAEDSGLIEALGDWVLRTACAQAAQWRRTGLDLTVAVNLSPRQFAASDLAARIVAALADCGLAPQALELEITEGVLMANAEAARVVIQTLRNHGVQVSLDDFGTGYSSLAYLTRMPIGHLKIDRCFVAGLLEGGESGAIVRAVLAMARSLGLRVTAEGVETEAQARALVAMACDSLQGYLFAAPVPAAEVPALVARCWPQGPAAQKALVSLPTV